MFEGERDVQQTAQPRRVPGLLIGWAIAVVLIGGVLNGYHQAYRLPNDEFLQLMEKPSGPQWRTLHVLSGGCGCSRRVMLHLLARKKFDHVEEQVLMVDGPGSYLPDVNMLLGQLQLAGFSVGHIQADRIPQEAGLHGVPLLVFASPEGKPAYVGGYGSAGDQDETIFANLRSGKAQKALNVVGCAVGQRLQRAVDPLRLRY